MTIKYGIQAPATYGHDTPVCGRCPRCHPGRQWGGDEKCRVTTCNCHATRGTS